MKKNILFVFSRIPHEDRDKQVYDLMNGLSGEYDVDVLYSQGMFMKEEALKPFEKLGANLIKLRSGKRGESLDTRITDILHKKDYYVIIFKNYLEARFYLPYVKKAGPDSIITAFIYDINYLVMMMDDYREAADAARLVDLNIVSKVSVYNFFDCLLLKEQRYEEFFHELIPEVPLTFLDDISNGKQAAGIVDNLKKRTFKKKPDYSVNILKFSDKMEPDEKVLKNAVPGGKYNVVDAHGSPVKACNEAVGKSAGDLVFIGSADILLTETAITNMGFCLSSSPMFGIAAPMPVLFDKSVDLKQRHAKHIVEHYASWEAVKQSAERCIMLKKQVFQDIGKFDEKFTTMRFAEIDFCWRALEKGFLTVISEDALVFYKTPGKLDLKKNEFKKDYDYLKSKWKDRGAGLLNKLEQDYFKDEKRTG